PLDALRVTALGERGVAQLALPLGGLLRQDVALERVTALDLLLARQLEALRRAPVRLHLRHAASSLRDAAYFFGATIMIIDRPSIDGLLSTFPTPCSASATSCSTWRPSSGCVICRPRNIIVTLTLSPSCRNRRACRILNSKSCGSMPGRILTSLIWIWCCFLRAARACRASSYLNLP